MRFAPVKSSLRLVKWPLAIRLEDRRSEFAPPLPPPFTMSFPSLYRLSFFLFVPLFATAADASRSFVERVRPDDFYSVETLFPEPLSPNHELVVLRTTAGKPVSVLAIAPAGDGNTFTVLWQLASTEAEGGWLKISDELDATVARQFLRAVELKLHHQVTLSKFKERPSKTDTDLWVYQRLSDNGVAAARIAMADTIDNPEATRFVDDLLGGLEKWVGKEGDERASLLQKIDRLATDIVLSTSP